MTVIFPIQTGDQRAVLGFAITFAILPAIFCCLRLLARRIRHRQLDVSDYLICAATVFAIALQSISITAVIQTGVGWDHVQNVILTYGPDPVTKLLKLIIPLQILWAISLSFSKAAIILLYLKVFRVPTILVVGYTNLGVIAAWCIGTIVAGLLICQPFAFNWDQTIPGGHCGNQILSFQVTGAINILTDVVVLLMPMPLLYSLQLPLTSRIVLIGVFSVGIVAIIISIMRVSYLSTMDFADITYSLPRANIFSGLEPSLAVCLACIPLLRPLFGMRSRRDAASDGTPKAPNGSGSGFNFGFGGGKGVSSGSGKGRVDQSKHQQRSILSSHDKNFEPLTDHEEGEFRTGYSLRPLGPLHTTSINSDRQPGGNGNGNTKAQGAGTGFPDSDEDYASSNGTSDERSSRGIVAGQKREKRTGSGRIHVRQGWSVSEGRPPRS